MDEVAREFDALAKMRADEAANAAVWRSEIALSTAAPPPVSPQPTAGTTATEAVATEVSLLRGENAVLLQRISELERTVTELREAAKDDEPKGLPGFSVDAGEAEYGKLDQLERTVATQMDTIDKLGEEKKGLVVSTWDKRSC